MIVPPYRNTLGTFSRAIAISVPGKLLSHPANPTSASYPCANIISSIESAITSRETSEAFIPSCPIAIPSETAMVTNSRGVPPADFLPIERQIAWRRFIPGAGDAHPWPVNLLIRQTHGPEKRSLGSPLASFRHNATTRPIHQNLHSK